MGIQINGNTDNISAIDGGLTISDLEINQTGISTFNGNIDANGDLDVDGHTNLDNVSIAGVSTFTGDVILTNSNHVTQVLKAGGSTSDLAIDFKDSSNNLESRIFCASDQGDLRFYTGGTNERLRINSSGKIGIGEASPDEILHITKNDTTGPTVVLENSANKTYINNWGSNGPSGRQNRFEINATSTTSLAFGAPYITFQTNGIGDSNEKLRITSAGDVTIGNSSVAFPSGGGLQVYNTGAARIKLANSSTGVASGDGFQIYVSGSGAYLDQKENAEMRFYTNAAERLRIASSGEVSIGTASGGKTLTLYGASSSSFRISKSGVLAYDHTFDGSTYTIANNNGSAGIPIVIGTKTGGGESLRITSAGNVIVNNDAVADSNNMFEVHKNWGGRIGLARDDTTTVAGNTIGALTFYGNDANGVYQEAAEISVHADLDHNTGDKPGRIVFSTTADGAASATERLRIKSDGDIVATGNLKTNNITGRNLVINGNFMIDQRNEGSELSITSNSKFSADRWTHNNDGFTYYKTQRRNDGSIQTTGEEYYMRVTVTTAVTLSGSTSQVLENNLEGYTVKHLNYGTSGAKQVTLSFWVRCSLTGTFGGALVNKDYNRSHPFSYTVNSANQWEYKTFTFSTTGFTTGSFHTGDLVGLRLVFSLGNGPGRQGATNQWSNQTKFGPTGETNLVATNGATLDLSSVQLEEGTQATRFEHRSYGEELSRCQRYFVSLGNNTHFHFGMGTAYNASALNISVPLPVPMRNAPTVARITNGSSQWLHAYVGATGTISNPTPQLGESGLTAYRVYCPSAGSGWTAGDSFWCQIRPDARLTFNAEL